MRTKTCAATTRIRSAAALPMTWEQVQRRLETAHAILNDESPLPVEDVASLSLPLRVGIDLGTADVVLMVLDARGEPVAAFLEWAEVVRDGVVTDFVGAVDIVRDLVSRAERRLGVSVTAASTSYPPGTDARLSTNILDSVGIDVLRTADEPSCVAALLHLDSTAVVDIGGGTTGTAVVRRGKVVFSGDEPSGGRHISLCIAGHFGIPLSEAETRKHAHDEWDLLPVARPTLERLCDIVAGHIAGHAVDTVLLSGGTCCLPGIDAVFRKELGVSVVLPCRPLLLTPLSIAALTL